MVNLLRSALFPLLITVVCAGLPAQDDYYGILLQDGQKHLDRGNLTSAERMFEEIMDAAVEGGRGAPTAGVATRARAGFCEVALRRGRYEDVLKEWQSQPAEVQGDRELQILRVRALAALGRYGEAEALLVAMSGIAVDAEVDFRLGEVRWLDGRRAAARELWRTVVGREAPADARGLAFVGRCHLALGDRTNLEAGSGVLVKALGLDADHAEARAAYGEMKFLAYREAAGHPSGERDLKRVLERHGDVEEALLALFRLRVSNFQLDPGKTEQLLQRALTLNPRSVPAIIERGKLLIADRRIKTAGLTLDEALQVNPVHREALAHRAAVAYLLHQEQQHARLRERALAGDPGWAELDRILADHLVALYRFGDAVPFYQAALKAEPGSIPALQGLAKARVYTGQGEEARRLLLQAKDLAGGLHDPWRNNAIAVQDLLAAEYTVVKDEHFAIHLHQDDAEVLTEYLVPAHLRALQVLGAKYAYRPDGPVRVETFHSWDDFSVRTIGFRGFTALGACFGPFITLVSPRDSDVRKLDFMWEATVWHEFTHVLTLGLSRHRVPRWLTEGFSVYEEQARDKSWERGMDRELLDAFHNRDIPPIAVVNRLFRGPRILFGYYQGGLIVDVIARDFGFDRALALLRAFGEDLDTEEAIEKALGISSAELDARLLTFVEKEKLRGMKLVPQWNDAATDRMLVRAASRPDDLRLYTDLAWAFVQRGNPVDAGRWLAEALRRDPEHGPALLVRAELLSKRGEREAALDHWRRGFAASAEDFDSRMACGRTLLAMEDVDGAEEQFQRAKGCWPGCTEQANAPELLLARLYRDLGRVEQATMELKSYCRRTARAYAPRWQLAEFEALTGQRQAELRWLTECNQIDPFSRELHERMGEALLALERKAEAAREFAVGAAVLPELERVRSPEAGREGGADDGARLQLRLRAARLFAEVGDYRAARAQCERVQQVGAGTDAASEAQKLLDEWRGR